METMNTSERLSQVRADIALLKAIVPADELTYRPTLFKDLTALQMAELVQLLEIESGKVDVREFMGAYEVYDRLDGVFVKATTMPIEGLGVSRNKRDELLSLLPNKAA